MSLRNRMYDRGWFRVRSVDVPVLSVGNLTLGGTGKTPLIAYLTQWCLEHRLQPGLVSRGYRTPGSRNSAGRSAESPHPALNDEGMELALRFPSVLHEQSPDRVAAARRLLERQAVDVILLDDGFQHRRIARNLDIVLLDSRDPFGQGHLFPRGLLRESVASLSRAGIVLLSRADGISGDERENIRRQVGQRAPQAVWGEIAHRPKELVSYFEEGPESESRLFSKESVYSVQKTCSIRWLEGRRVFAFGGIARPDLFLRTLKDCNAEIVGSTSFPDHHCFSPDNLRELADKAKRCKAEAILCTMKDLVKIRRKHLGNIPLWAVAIGIEFLNGADAFDAEIRRVLGRGSPV